MLLSSWPLFTSIKWLNTVTVSNSAYRIFVHWNSNKTNGRFRDINTILILHNVYKWSVNLDSNASTNMQRFLMDTIVEFGAHLSGIWCEGSWMADSLTQLIPSPHIHSIHLNIIGLSGYKREKQHKTKLTLNNGWKYAQYAIFSLLIVITQLLCHSTNHGCRTSWIGQELGCNAG